MVQWVEDEEDEYEPQGRGRSARKREVRGFDLLADELLEITDAKVEKLPVTEELKNALRIARATTAMKAKAARKRYIKHLSSLLREREAEVVAIRNFLSGSAYTQVTGDESYRDLDAMRTSLCDEQSYQATLQDVCAKLPHIDLALLTKLATQLHKEDNDKAFRALYKELRRAADESDRDAEEASAEE